MRAPWPTRATLWDEAVALIREHRSASISFLQRKLRIGYARAGRLIDQLEAAGVVGPAQPSGSRDVLAQSDAAVADAADFKTRLDRAFQAPGGGEARRGGDHPDPGHPTGTGEHAGGSPDTDDRPGEAPRQADRRADPGAHPDDGDPIDDPDPPIRPWLRGSA